MRPPWSLQADRPSSCFSSSGVGGRGSGLELEMGNRLEIQRGGSVRNGSPCFHCWNGWPESDRLDRSLEESIHLVLPYTARTAFSFSSHSLYTPTSFGRSLTSRESEAAYLEKLNEGIAKGTSWERVTEMIQLENSRKSHRGR